MDPEKFMQLLTEAPNFANKVNRAMGRFGPKAVSQFFQKLTPQDVYQLADDNDEISSSAEKIRRKKDKSVLQNVGKLSATLASLGAFAYMGASGAVPSLASAAEKIIGRAQGGGEPQEGEPPPPEPQPQPAQEPEKPKSLVQSVLQALDLGDLNDMQSQKINRLAQKLEGLEGKGKGPKDSQVKNLIRMIKKTAEGGIADQERKRFENAYGKQDQDERIDRQVEDRLRPDAASKVKDTPKLEKGDLVETKQGKNGRVVSVDYDRGIAKIKIDKKIHNKKIDDLTPKDWNDLKSAVIQEYAYNPDQQVALLKFRKGPWYGYQAVSKDSFERFSKGKGTAKTTGEANGFRWWKGKNPSLGAAFWKEIRGKNPYARLDETIDVDYFFTNFDQISPDLPWKVPEPKKKKRRKKR